MGELEAHPMPKTTVRFAGSCDKCHMPLDTKVYKVNIEGYEINNLGVVANESYRDKTPQMTLCYKCKVSVVHKMSGKDDYGNDD